MLALFHVKVIDYLHCHGFWPHSCYLYLVEFPDARRRPSLVVGVFAVVAVLIVACCSCCSMCSCCSSILAT